MKEKLEVIRGTLEMYSDGELHGNVPAINSLVLLDTLIAELESDELVRTIKTSNTNKDVLIDAEDWPILSRYTWSENVHGYAITGGNEKYTIMHRMIVNPPSVVMVDHRNGNKLDNRKANLRNCNSSQNQMNRACSFGHSSQYKGVAWKTQNKKWAAYITIDKKKKHLGYFENEEDAGEAYNRAAIEVFGEFAYANKTKKRNSNAFIADNEAKAAINVIKGI